MTRAASQGGAGEGRPMRGWRRLVGPSDALIVAMATVAGTGLLGVLQGWAVAGLALFGGVVAALAAVVVRRFDLVVTESVALSLFLFGLFGGMAVGPYPSPSAYAGFLRGVTAGWADLLSTVPPSDPVGDLRALPYTIGWLAATTGFEIERRARVPGLPLLGPMAGFGLAVLFSLEDRVTALAQGGLLITLGLGLGTVQQRRYGIDRDESLGTTTAAGRRRRVLGAALVLGLVAVTAPAAAPYVPGSEARERFDLRDRLEPPWDPLAVPSPLAQLKGNFIPENRDQVVFTARGDSIPTRWALATLGHFDGTVWTVGDSSLGGAAQFVPIDGPTPPRHEEPTGPGRDEADDRQEPEKATVEVEIVSHSGTWLPLPGRATRIELTPVGPGPDPAAADPAVTGGLSTTRGAVRFNQRTGTAALPAQVWSGLSYSATVTDWPAAAGAPGGEPTIGSTGGTNSGTELAAPSLAELAEELLLGSDEGWPQVEALRSGLIDTGYYLSDEQARPGHSWVRLGDFAGGDPVYGFEEQYAATAALVARSEGLPARVVVGYLLEPEQARTGEVEVTRSQASAWIEVLTVEQGWVPVDVTPPRDKAPTLTGQGAQRDETGAVTPPPPPPPVEQNVAQRDDPQPEETTEPPPLETGSAGWVVVATVTIAAVATPLLAIALVAGLVVAWKRVRTGRRRRRGRPAERIAGAWLELEDRLQEAGIEPSPAASLGEVGTFLVRNGSMAGAVATLTRAVDRAAFDPVPPMESQAGAAWDASDTIVAGLRARARAGRRARMLVDPLPLLRRRRRGWSR